MKNPWKLILPFFLLGFLCGTGAGSWAQRRAAHGMWRKGMDTEGSLKRLTGKLSLDAAQQAAIRPILEARKVKISALHDETMTRFLAIRAAMREEMMKALRPDQRAIYEGLFAKADARYKDMIKNETAPR